jgi:hypothetical protein
MIELHWLNGLEEYFDSIDHPQREKYHRIKQAVVNGSPYAIRDCILDEIHRGYTDKTSGFLNIIMQKFLDNDDIEMTNRRILEYISHCIDDDFLKEISRWSSRWGEKVNLNDHFSRGQMKSKFWLISQLNNLNIEPKNVALLGGWYATIAYFFFLNWDSIEKFRNYEIDSMCLAPADDFNFREWKNNWQFKTTEADACNLRWEPPILVTRTQNVHGRMVREDFIPDLIVNTSCEHMTDKWFYDIPQGHLVALQTNDYFENEQHVNCVHDIKEALEKYQFQQVLYSGTLDTQLYKRFMIIGRR